MLLTKAVKPMSNNILVVTLGAALIGATTFGLYTGFRFLERVAINRHRTGSSFRELYDDNEPKDNDGD